MNDAKPPIETFDPELGRSLRSGLTDIKLIATGGMSYVFRAYQPSLGRHLVVKRLKDELLASPETLERFRREARALACVLHQNIAHVYDFVEVPGEAFILMEFIDGIDLSTVIEKIGHLPPSIAAAIALGVARGLDHIHAHGLIHRDVKPSNIRLNSRGGVKLMDFGIVLELTNTSLTREGMMVGSPSYLSPEQVLGDTITAQSDIFLLGITLYEMLTATRPFKAEGGNTIFQSIREASFVSAKRMNPRVPAYLDAVVSRCLRQDPNQRFDGVRSVIAALENYLGPEISNRPEEHILRYLDQEVLVQPAIATRELARKPHRNPVWRKWAWAAATTALIAAAFWLGYQRGQVLQQEQIDAVRALETKSKSRR